MNEQLYPFVTPPKHAKKEKNKEKKPAKGAETFSMLADGQNESDLLENPRIFVYVVGGLSHHEMCAIAELQNKIKAQIVPGSNEILTSNQFLKQLEELHKIDMKKVIAEGDLKQFLGLSGLGNQSDTDMIEDSD